ncbi:MAG: gas vesicle protein GvpN [Dehalococcoidia bacterium]
MTALRDDALASIRAQDDGNGSTDQDEMQEALTSMRESLAARPRFVETLPLKGIVERALAYAESGLTLHFRGPTGSGKTTLAIHVAEQIGRPLMLIGGDDEFSTSDLVGGQHGYTRRRTIDNYIHSVMKTEDRVDYTWTDARLTVACQEGYTLIYDEFNRSRPEANNVLLPVLEEKILILPSLKTKKGYVRVHPQFRAIFTSNPKEYSGVHSSQDALLDRMITMDLGHFDEQTEIAITQAHTGLTRKRAQTIVALVRRVRQATNGSCDPTIRSCIMIGKIMANQNKNGNGGGLAYEQVCVDVLTRTLSAAGRGDEEKTRSLTELVARSRWN